MSHIAPRDITKKVMYANHANNHVMSVILTVTVQNVLVGGICFKESAIKGIVLFTTSKLLLMIKAVSAFNVTTHVGSVMAVQLTVLLVSITTFFSRSY